MTLHIKISSHEAGKGTTLTDAEVVAAFEAAIREQYPEAFITIHDDQMGSVEVQTLNANLTLVANRQYAHAVWVSCVDIIGRTWRRLGGVTEDADDDPHYGACYECGTTFCTCYNDDEQ